MQYHKFTQIVTFHSFHTRTNSYTRARALTHMHTCTRSSAHAHKYASTLYTHTLTHNLIFSFFLSLIDPHYLYVFFDPRRLATRSYWAQLSWRNSTCISTRIIHAYVMISFKYTYTKCISTRITHVYVVISFKIIHIHTRTGPHTNTQMHIAISTYKYKYI